MTEVVITEKAGIHVDIGGTFTDCVVAWGDKVVRTKAPTTGYNLSVGFMNALRDAAAACDVSLKELIAQCDLVNYATTIAMNTLIERKGPKLALLCTAGFEDIIPIGKGSSWGDSRTVREIRNIARIEKPEPLIPPEMTVGVKERVDYGGQVLRPLDEEHFLEELHRLVGKGARGFVVSLMWSFLNPVHEQRIKEIIEREFPDSYLGSMPVILSSEICPKRFEYTRTVTSILNTYLHESMWEQLCGMGDELRDLGYTRGLMMVHNSGGTAEVFRTSAIQTFNGGPVAGIIGGAYLGKLLGFENVIVTDMGGTSFDIGAVVHGSTRFYDFRPVIDKWWVDMTMLESKSIGAGGGSIAWLNKIVGNSLEVGPQGAGSLPGPAAYDMGGTEPTVTDADIVLGYINPDYYFGGKMKLNARKAEAAIRRKIAQPLHIDTVEAAALIKRVVDANMASLINKEIFLKGYDPKDFVLFAAGGAGPTHCCGYAEHAGIKRIVAFPFASVYCAFGSSCLDLTHVYERTARVPLLAWRTMAPFTDYDAFNEVVAALKEQALQDLAGEGFSPNSVTFKLELDMQYGEQVNLFRVSSPLLEIHSEQDVRTVYQQFEREYGDFFSPYAVYPEGGVDIFGFVLKAIVPRSKPRLPIYPLKGKTPAASAAKGSRPVYWEMFGHFYDTPIYDERGLAHGNVIDGPAVIEAETNTTVLPPGWKLSVDQYLNLILESE